LASAVLNAFAMDAPTARGALVALLIGEFLREAAVLIAIFVPLDRTNQGVPLTAGFLGVTLLCTLTVLAMGIWLEVRFR
jgi:hypothetical protein